MTARRVLAFIAFWMLLWAAPVVGQDHVLSDEVIQLRLDLMVQRGETIQARSERLVIEQQLLEMDLRDFRVDRDALQEQLNAHCGGVYDLAARTCAPDPPVPPPTLSEEDDPS